VIRVFVVASVRLYREGLAELLPRREGIEIVGSAESWAQGADEMLALAPDIVLLDTAVADGARAISEIVRNADGAKVVALSVAASDGDVIAYAEAGVSGYVARDESLDDLVTVVRSVARGEVACAPSIAAALLRRVSALSTYAHADADDRLTRREEEIAGLLVDGLSNKEIAGRLCIEPATVKNHVHHILEKLGARSRFEVAARLGRRTGSAVWGA
jgi:two-component system, NarL family, nitrate/nitrite response regulator NarL